MGGAIDFITKAAALALAPATGGFSLSGFLLSTAASFALSAAARALAPKPKMKSFSPVEALASLTQAVRQPIMSRRLVYGLARASGGYIFIGSSSNDLYLHQVITLASHEIEGVVEVWLNDTSIPMDALDENGMVTSGRYKDLVRIKIWNGTDDQTADADLTAACPEWTASHRARGIACIYIRLKANRDKYPGGLPNPSVVFRGKKILDPRDDQVKWSPNSSLHTYDYLLDERYGFGADENEIDQDQAIAAANLSDEMVAVTNEVFSVSSVDHETGILSLSGTRLSFMDGDRVQLSGGGIPDGASTGVNYYVIAVQFKDKPRLKLASSLENALAGIAITLTSDGSGPFNITKNAEPRYHAGGVVDTDDEPKKILEEMLTTSAGRLIFSGGLWRIMPAAYYAPDISFDENDFLSPITVQTRLTRRERFNSVKGVFASPLYDFQPSDYPIVRNSAAVSDDGFENYTEYNQPYTQRSAHAQRVPKIELMRMGQEIIVRGVFGLRALSVQAGSTVLLSNARFGWVDKVFECTEWALTTANSENGDAPHLAVEMTLRETSSALTSWTSGEALGFDPAPNTNLPNPYDVYAPVGLSFKTVPVQTVQSDLFYNLVLGWDTHESYLVRVGGKFEIQFRYYNTEDVVSEWSPSQYPEGELNSCPVTQGSLGVKYDIRIRAKNNLGTPSEWSYLYGAIVGLSGGVTEIIDMGHFIGDPITDYVDMGAFDSDPVSSTVDLGTFS